MARSKLLFETSIKRLNARFGGNFDLGRREVHEQMLQRYFISEVFRRGRPSLNRDAFRVTDVEPKFNGSRIWLSESCMTTLSFLPGSTVRVSLASSKMNILSGFPLDSLTDECARHFGIDVGDGRANEVGNYFALTKLFPSREVSGPKLLPYECLPLQVLKNELRLSWDLSWAIGCPASGRIMFVFPIQTTNSLTSFTNGTGNLYSSTNTTVPCLSIHSCKELYLELVPSKKGSTLYGDMLSPVSSICKSNAEISEEIRDECTKKLLQECARMLLHTRILLHGNLVAFRIHSGLCIFCVEGAENLSTESPNQELTDEENHDSLPQTPNLVDHVDGAFVVHHGTNVHLSTPVELEFKYKSNVESDFSKLGGLSKEYVVLKKIIASLSMQDTLSSFIWMHYQRVALLKVFIDELDAITPARKDGGEELSQRMVATLLNLMDGISRTDGLLVIAATNRPDSIDPALRRHGRLDREIEIGVPSPKQRLEILLTLLTDIDHSLVDLQVQQIKPLSSPCTTLFIVLTFPGFYT
ncbi:hypothetical protein HHK36_020036 [Tetracentron sinense]|uniref:ATPase AAA-type core domain-containing protein n=1 Tax=Tetracentron sinense TaxID=13715 RepID=A0A835D807_TETSI|nr:hypothetical protein HHK36_020036 [Tetracentron sinense]